MMPAWARGSTAGSGTPDARVRFAWAGVMPHHGTVLPRLLPRLRPAALLLAAVALPATLVTPSAASPLTTAAPSARAATLVPSVVPLAPSVDAAAAESRIVRKIAKRLASPRLGRDVAVLVMDAADNRVLYAVNADARMLPASNMKIVTATTVLAALGPDAVFRTRVVAGANPGELVLVGGGDPLLSSKDLKSLAEQVAPALDPSLPWTVLVDESLFPVGPSGVPLDAAGWPSSYTPSIASPVRALSRLWDYSNDTATNAAKDFAKSLTKLGVTASVGARTVAPAGAAQLGEVAVHTVADAVRVMLSISENNVAETLYRQVAVARGLPGSWVGSRKAAMAVLVDLGIDTSGVALRDGSGLSRKDRLNALFLANVLRLTRTDPRFAAMYVNGAMPTSGVDGTLASKYGRYSTSPTSCARGAIRAKTGTLFDTISLSGVTTGTDGREKVFSILVNDRPRRFSQLATRQAVDRLAATITGCF